MKIVACIPTCKRREDVANQIEQMLATSTCIESVYASCTPASASKNRNLCLDNCKEAEIIIMADDDILGFYPGWDIHLVSPLLVNDNIGMVAARLLKMDGSYNHMMGCSGDFITPQVDVVDNQLCTACFAFRQNSLRFDENYLGSGFEDSSLSLDFVKMFPYKRMVINNLCKLKHINEMKNQKGKYWEHNKAYFLKRHPEQKDRWHN